MKKRQAATARKTLSNKPRKLVADAVKGVVIDSLLTRKKQPDLIATEVAFMSQRRFVDLVCIIDGQLHSFEIKGERDTLRRLPGQLADQAKVFEFTSVVTTKNHLSRVKRHLGKRIGIVLVDDGKVRWKRRPCRSQSIDKYLLCGLFDRKSLLSMLKSTGLSGGRSESIVDLKRRASKINERTLMRHAKAAVREKFRLRFSFFLKERGQKTTVHDIVILRQNATFTLSKPEILTINV